MDFGSDMGVDNPSPNTGKRQKCILRTNEALTSVMETNREKVVFAFTNSEDREDVCYREVINLETRKHNDIMTLKKNGLRWLKKLLQVLSNHLIALKRLWELLGQP